MALRSEAMIHLVKHQDQNKILFRVAFRLGWKHYKQLIGDELVERFFSSALSLSLIPKVP